MIYTTKSFCSLKPGDSSRCGRDRERGAIMKNSRFRNGKRTEESVDISVHRHANSVYIQVIRNGRCVVEFEVTAEQLAVMQSVL